MLGQEIRKRRTEKGMNQTELAGALYITQPRLARIEADLQPASVAQVKRLAEIFGCTTDALIKGE